MPRPLAALQPSGRLYLMIAILIFGAASAVTRKLTDIGANNLIDGRNPISFCNVLFVGNLCALIIFIILNQRQWRVSILKRIRPQQWLTLSMVAVISSAVVPSLIFTALTITSVNNVILIGQLDTPLALGLSVWFLGDRINKWVVYGAILSFIGVALTVLIQPESEDVMMSAMGIQIGLGELLVLLAALLKAIANTVSRISLRQIPLGIFNVYRMFVGTVFFFCATFILLGPSHFMDVTAGFVWRWMLLYGAVIVVGSQLAWFKGISMSSASEISFATAFNPLAGILAAYLILGEVPTLGQYVGGAVILAGIALNQVGVQRLQSSAMASAMDEPKPKQALSESVGFEGV
ncbi:MAG: DMT family transporter [Cyanobacteria bacterium P01_F01_bin.3]